MNTPSNGALCDGAWLEFVYRWSLPGDVLRKILFLMMKNELLVRYLSPIPLNIKHKRVTIVKDGLAIHIIDKSLQDIRETVETKAAKGGCHPGRLTLNPEVYHRVFTDRINPQTISRRATPSRKASRRGGRRSRPPAVFQALVNKYQRCGIGHHLRDLKHRLLDEEGFKFGREGDVYGRTAGQGLQDIYFIGGLPLTFWSYNGSMGMKIIDPVIRNGAGAALQGPAGLAKMEAGSRRIGLTKNPYYQWPTEEKLQEYQLLPHLEDEFTFWNKSSSAAGQEYLYNNRQTPRTASRWGSDLWIERHAGGKAPFCPDRDGPNDAYALYLQTFEDAQYAEGKYYGWQ